MTRSALLEKDLMAFCACLNDYQSELHAQQLTHPNTLAILQQHPLNEARLAMKGCGALGADVILSLQKLVYIPVANEGANLMSIDA